MNQPWMAAPGQTVICGFCGAPTPTDQNARCVQCGGPIRLLEPLAVDCGWCGVSNRRDQVDTCQSCGGPLPALPMGNPGPTPPQTPRPIPPGYANRITYWKNVHVMIGIIFSIAFCWTIIFPIVGIPMWISGQRRAKRKLASLQLGTATRGRILSVAEDTTQHINNQHPLRIDYEFDTPSGKVAGYATAWDYSNQRRQPGHVLWVVYTPEDPAQNAIWPPIR